jgi:phosphatidylethanolamine/phosphatidyl-N-methylethanolamine N-methyltransferase
MNFFEHFIKSAKHTGAIAQSSHFLAKKMVRKSNLNNVKTIVELGPGMGPITKKIIEEMPTGSQLLTFEINKEFVEYLNKKYPEARHIHADIKNLKKNLQKNNLEKVDVIISGIPFAGFKKKECDAMFREIRDIMHPDSRFILFTYSSIKFKSFFSQFEKLDVSYVPLNIPPAYVITLRKKLR